MAVVGMLRRSLERLEGERTRWHAGNPRGVDDDLHDEPCVRIQSPEWIGLLATQQKRMSRGREERDRASGNSRISRPGDGHECESPTRTTEFGAPSPS